MYSCLFARVLGSLSCRARCVKVVDFGLIGLMGVR